MCGICGIIEFEQNNIREEKLRSMMAAMKYRGPDDEGVFLEDGIGLGFVRLSILDLSMAGHQPMFSADERYVIIFNGEIYNYIELRRELVARGYQFRSQTDTEVLLNAYIEWGEKSLDKLNGMWAFVIYDRRNKTCFISRDRFGIKPFYYYLDEKRFIFASDFAPILRMLETPVEANEKIIYDYLVFNRTNHKPETFFKNIKKLQHSHSIVIEGNEIRFHRYYNLQEKLTNPIKSPEDFLDSFKLSITQQLRSDVPLGACLSGGLDSSSIVSVIQKYFHNPEFHTFSAVYNFNQIGDESKYIEMYRDVIKNMHFAHPTASTLLEDLDTYVESMGEPIPGTSEYAEYKVMQVASEHCTVILNGQGADEEMAGYLYFFGVLFKELLRKGNIPSIAYEMAKYMMIHRNTMGIKSFIYFMIPPSLKNDLVILTNKVIGSEFLRTYYRQSHFEVMDNLYYPKSLRQSFLDHFEYKFEHNLLWADKSGMWFSIETRFPFLDHNFVERILSTPPKMILSNGTTKRILRDSMKSIVPEQIRSRKDKVGYETPENEWFREKKLSTLIMDLLSSEKFASRGYINRDHAIKLFNRHKNGNINYSKEIWKWIHLELWFRKFIDK